MCVRIAAIGEMELMCLVVVLMCSVTYSGEKCINLYVFA